MRSAQQVHKLLKASRRTSRLLQRVERGRQLTHDIQTLLPSPLASYCQAGDLVEHKLTIITTSPVWAAKLRYLQPTLLQAFRSIPTLAQVTEINIKISNQPQHRQTPARGRKAHMSPQSAELIRQTADSIEDPALRESLLKLSRHAKDKADGDSD
jgi:hypothetical protein